MTIQVKDSPLCIRWLDQPYDAFQNNEYFISNEENCIGVARMNYSYEITVIYVSALLLFILNNRKEKNVII